MYVLRSRHLPRDNICPFMRNKLYKKYFKNLMCWSLNQDIWYQYAVNLGQKVVRVTFAWNCQFFIPNLELRCFISDKSDTNVDCSCSRSLKHILHSNIEIASIVMVCLCHFATLKVFLFSKRQHYLFQVREQGVVYLCFACVWMCECVYVCVWTAQPWWMQLIIPL